MNDEQRIVTAWMQRVMQDAGLSAEQWAAKAGVAGTSITRAMRESYPGTSTLPLLHRLALAAGVPSPLDFLDGRNNLPSEAEIAAACTVALAMRPAVTADELARLIVTVIHRRS